MTTLRQRFAAFRDPKSVTRVVEGHQQVDPDDDLYRSIGASQRELHGSVLRRAQDLSVQMYRSNPLANRIAKIYTSFMAGEGFTLDARNPVVQEVADEFWFAERNQMDLHHRGFARDFLLFGEAIHPVAVEEGSGATTIGYIDPISVDHIERNSLNQMLLEAVILTRAGAEGDDPLMTVRREEDPFDDAAGLYIGDVFVWLYDRIGASSRGTPFMLPILDWLDAYDQTLWELLERMKATRAYFWDVTVDGDGEDVKRAQKDWGTTAPRSGSVRFKTKAIDVQASQPALGAHEDVAASRYLLRHIATGSGLAPHWLGDPEDANRSTAERMDTPVFKALSEVQTTWKRNMTQVMRFVIDQKVKAGILDRRMEVFNEAGDPTGEMEASHDLIMVSVPNITDEDVAAAAAALSSLATAFVQLDTISVVDRNVISAVVRKILPALGIPADELPEPDEDMTDDDRLRQDLDVLESFTLRARRGNVDELVARIED